MSENGNKCCFVRLFYYDGVSQNLGMVRLRLLIVGVTCLVTCMPHRQKKDNVASN